MPARSHICAVIPTYNNGGAIVEVLRRVYAQMPDIIVVADGPTDSTLQLLAELGSEIPFTLVSYSRNRGKGYALKQGFRKAREMGYTHVLTIDADLQHYPEDIPLLYRAHSLHPDAIIIGSRELKQENMPAKSTFANRFSNFWFALQTGTRLPDTQTGFRIYPLRKIRGERILTSRYEAELELLVFSAWAEVSLIPVPVRVYYPPFEERVSHFRPAYDFTRISVLNTILCLLALVYGLPRRWWRSLYLYTLFFLMVVCVIQPALIGLRLRYGDTAEMRRRLHLLMQRCGRFFLSSNPGVPFRISCEEGATPLLEDRPSIIIANHSSLLDLLGIMALHTRVAIVTKDWVSRNILFGAVARSFDILPASSGIEVLLPEIKKKVEEGFSIVVLPEGTRSKTGDLSRFHRGAFYLAQQLGLPVRPVLIRGTFLCLNRVHIRVGIVPEIALFVLPEITPDDARFPADYRERTKAVAQYYRERLDVFAYPYSAVQ